MTVLKATCPKCRFLFPAPSAAVFNCPKCKARLDAALRAGSVSSSAASLPESTAEPAERRNHVAARLILASLLCFFLSGIGVTIYLVNMARQPQEQDAAHADPSAPQRTREEPNGSTESPSAPERNAGTPAVASFSSEQEAKINQAIDRGVKYLKGRLSAFHQGQFQIPGHQEGAVSLIGLTLLECGTPPDDPDLRKAADYLRPRVPSINNTYDISCAILFLDRLGDPGNRDLIQTLALRLVAGQLASGTWNYHCSAALTAEEEQQFISFLKSAQSAYPNDKEKLGGATAAPPAKLRNAAVAQALKGAKPSGARGDNSNTQFALLALWVARRHALPVQPSLALVDQHFRTTQASEGSWSYRSPSNSHRASMTCVGLLGLAVGHSINLNIKDGDANKAKDEAIEKGLRYLGTTIGVRGKGRPGGTMIGADSHSDLYYLWSVERVAMIYDLKTIGGKDWYAWASDVLLKHQKPDGSWQNTFDPSIDTCFALLVLKRVNVVKDLTTNIKKVINIKDLEGP